MFESVKVFLHFVVVYLLSLSLPTTEPNLISYKTVKSRDIYPSSDKPLHHSRSSDLLLFDFWVRSHKTSPSRSYPVSHPDLNKPPVLVTVLDVDPLYESKFLRTKDTSVSGADGINGFF